ncbi:MAG: ROK family protein [Gammaproteobacteria bacterium]
MFSTRPLWGVDLGGSKIECVVLESALNPVVIERRRIDTEAEQGYEHVLQRVQNLVNKMEWDTGLVPDEIGFGTPGSIDPESGLLRGSNSQHLTGQPIKQDLEDMLDLPVVVQNDANCFALAESRIGVLKSLDKPKSVVFGVILGTGVGGGLVVEGRLLRGSNLIAGEWGHNFMDASGGSCYCGKTGCVETVISGPALEDYYWQQSGSSLPLSQIVVDAKKDNADATATIDRLIHFFGIGMSTIINTIDPDVIVIGGGVGNINALYSRGVEETKKYVFTPNMKTRIVKPQLGDSAGVFGNQ